MIGAFPQRGGWITLQLAPTGDHDEPLLLLELAGGCPGDPAAAPVRASACANRQDARDRAAERLAAGWAAHSTTDRPAAATTAAAALHPPRRNPAPAPRDRRLSRGDALAVVAHALAGEPEPFCLFPNPTARG